MMYPNRIIFAQEAKRLIARSRPFRIPPIPPHACGVVCVQPLVFGTLGNAFVEDGLLSATVFADYEVHRRQLTRVWLGVGPWGEFLDITRYVLPKVTT